MNELWETVEMATPNQNIEFTSSILPVLLLDDAIEWISRNLSPDEVFEKGKLAEWAEDNGYEAV